MRAIRAVVATVSVLSFVVLGDIASAKARPAPGKPACGARIEQGCGGLRERGAKRCRKAMLRSCRQSAPEVACAVEQSDGGTASPKPGNPAEAKPEDPAEARANADRIRAAIANRSLSTGHSEIFSGGSITRETTLTLCGSGQFSLLIVRITAAPGVADLGGEERVLGAWTVEPEGNGFVMSLVNARTSARETPPIELRLDGTIALDGLDARIVDASEACGAAPGGNLGTRTDPSTPPGGSSLDALVPQVTARLADHVLGVQEASAVGTITKTVLLLCASGRYALEVADGAAPEAVQSDTGRWQLAVAGTALVLQLASDRGSTPVAVTIGEDAQGNLLFNGLVVERGDPSVVQRACPAL